MLITRLAIHVINACNIGVDGRHRGPRRRAPPGCPADRASVRGRPPAPATPRPACGASRVGATPSPWWAPGSSRSAWWPRPLFIDRWWAYLLAFFLMGRGFALLNILGHEAAHRLLFSRRRINDLVGRWLLAYPAFMPFDLYRRSHMAHHRDETGSRRTRHWPVRRAIRSPGASHAPQAHPRRRGHLRLEEPGAAAAGHDRGDRRGRWRCASWASRPCSGPRSGWPAGSGGCTRCCGWPRG